MNRIIPGFLMSCLLLAACDRSVPYAPDADALGHTAPTAATIAANRAVREELDRADRQDFDDATRGLIASDPALRIVRRALPATPSSPTPRPPWWPSGAAGGLGAGGRLAGGALGRGAAAEKLERLVAASQVA